MDEVKTAERQELPAVNGADEQPVERERNERGQFVQGVSGNPAGRPVGSRNKLVEDFLADFHAAWKEHGAAALRKMASTEPAAFVQAGVKLMPRDVLLEAKGAGLVVVQMASEDFAL